MATRVLDAHAVLAFLQDEPGADDIRSLLPKAEEGGVNLGEVWYAIARVKSPETADQHIQQIRGMAIEIVDIDWPLRRQAAAYRGRIAFADCFAAALARSRRGEIVTGNREFRALEDEIGISWIQ